MAKSQSSSIEKVARLLDLVPFISSHQGISIADLAKNFSVTEKEIFDDLNTLWMCGLPGYTPLELIDLSFDSGFVSIRNAEILQRVRQLSKEELVVVLIGLDLLSKSIGTDRADISKSITGLQEKVRAIVGQVASAEPIVNSAYRAAIMKAMKERRDLEMEYHSLIRDQITLRKITPLEVGEDHGFEILKAFCHSVEDFRIFRLENIRSLVVSEDDPKPFNNSNEIDANFQVQLLVQERVRSGLERFRVDVKDFIDSKTVVIATSFSKDWLMRSVLSTLATTKLVGPPEMINEVSVKVKQMLALYLDPIFAD
jgi:proteasome accessory factor C